MAKKGSTKPSGREDADQQAALLEARRWALVTVWQVERYLDAAAGLGGVLPTSASAQRLKTFYEQYDRVVAEAYFSGLAVTQCSRWFRVSDVPRSGAHGEAAALIRVTAKWWSKHQKDERRALRDGDLVRGLRVDRSDWLVADGALFGEVAASDVRDAAAQIAEVLTGRLRAA